MRGVRGSGKAKADNTASGEGTEDQGSKKSRMKVLKIGNEVIRPYLGKDELPKEELDNKGNVIKPGQSRHFLARHGNVYKLIKVYRAKGIKHSLVRMIKPNIKNKPGEKALLLDLKKRDIPGAI